MKINIVGTITGITGYDIHTRSLANALYDLNPDIKLEVPLPPDWLRMVNDAELQMITKETRKADVTICITQPQFWRVYMDNCKKFVGFLVWEGDKIPLYWIDYLLDERVNQIWVPSEHTKDAVLKTTQEVTIGEFHPFKGWTITDYTLNREKITKIIKEKIKIVPHGVDTNLFKPKSIDK